MSSGSAARPTAPAPCSSIPTPTSEDEFHTETGGEILLVQYPGPTTGGRPIFAGRFDMEERKPLAEERRDI